MSWNIDSILYLERQLVLYTGHISGFPIDDSGLVLEFECSLDGGGIEYAFRSLLNHQWVFY